MQNRARTFTRLWIPLMCCLALLVAACAPITAVPTPPAAPVVDATPVEPAPAETPVDDLDAPDDEEVGMLVRQAVMAQTQIDFDQIEVIAVEPMEWPDACLGLAAPGEFCAQVITPGYEVTLRVEGEEHVFRTDEGVTTIRPEVTEVFTD